MKSLFQVFFIFLVVVSTVESQESIGLHSDVYSGTDLMIWNPANSLSSANSWDVTLGSAHVFGFTDYATISNTSLSNLASSIRDGTTIDGRSFIPENPGDQPLAIFDTDFGDKRFSSNIQLSAPAFTFSIKDKWKVGMFSRFRAHISAQKIPEALGIYELNDARFVDFALDIESFEAAAMFWTEIGGHVATQINDNLSVGINLKYFFGSEAAFLDNNSNGTIAIDSTNIASDDVVLNAAFGFTRDVVDMERFSLTENNSSGLGIGADIGMSYTSNNWSVGVSLIDIGSVRFGSDHELYSISAGTDIELLIADYEVLNTSREFLDQVISDFDLEDRAQNNDVTIGLPTALILQGSYQFNNQMNVSGQLVQRVALASNSIQRENSLAITPHYSSKWISVFAPVTLYEYSKLRLGLAARFGILTIGSDHLGTLLRKHNFRGSDIYVKLSFAPIFSSDEKRASRRSRNKGVECYTF